MPNCAFEGAHAASIKGTPHKKNSPEEIDAAMRQIILRQWCRRRALTSSLPSAKKLDRVLSEQFLTEVRDLKHKNVDDAAARKSCSRTIKLHSTWKTTQLRKMCQDADLTRLSQLDAEMGYFSRKIARRGALK